MTPRYVCKRCGINELEARTRGCSRGPCPMEFRPESWSERHSWRGWPDVPILVAILAAWALFMLPMLVFIWHFWPWR
jgi:hypothetical protein